MINRYWQLGFYNGNPFMAHIGKQDKYGFSDYRRRRLTIYEYIKYLFKIIRYKIIFEYDMRKFKIKNII